MLAPRQMARRLYVATAPTVTASMPMKAGLAHITGASSTFGEARRRPSFAWILHTSDEKYRVLIGFYARWKMPTLDDQAV